MATKTIKPMHTPPAGVRVPHTKIPTRSFEIAKEVDHYVASMVADLIREKNAAGQPAVLGLPTGSTPIGVYRELIRMHKDENLDFSNVITFNLDEYWPIEPNSIHSYHRFMRETFFDHVNIPEDNIHIPQGNIAREDVEAFCDEYEQDVEKVGGIDLQLLGIGRSGHIGFNEPGSSRNSLTRLVTLDPVTRMDAAGDFFGEENVPLQAITMGVGTILSAKKIITIALGEHKAPVVRRAIEGQVTEDVTASFLQTNRAAMFCIDEAAAGELTAVKTPWLAGPVDWTAALAKRAVIWLSRKVEKPLLKLEARDFMDHHLHDLIRSPSSPDAVRQRMFQDMLSGICTHPGGYERQGIIVFSPHPDDDVISMGGTLITLAEQGHDVYIAYMTSGNVAVFDHDALRHVEYVHESQLTFDLETEKSARWYESICHDIATKKPGDPDSDQVLDVKALIRKTEATAGAEVAGVPSEKLRFLDMPFYRTGEATKRPIEDEDIQIIADLLRELNPGQIYVAGDLSDPHGTHRMCARAVVRALDAVQPAEISPEVWLYRGAWQEYEPHEIERAVPLSPETVTLKKLAIFKHESQKDRALYPGRDTREFWVRAEQRTKNTARVYDELGLPEYFALEGFVRFSGQL
jgi:glucosamine-6-phosphate deaminase